jgi:hypothetical protein
MGLGEDEVMTYRLAGGPLWNSCWQLLDEEEKVEVRATMRREALAACKKGAEESLEVEARATMREEALAVKEKGADVSKAEVTERAAKMGLGPNGRLLYTFGHGNLYYPVWHLLSSEGTRRGPIADAGKLLYNTWRGFVNYTRKQEPCCRVHGRLSSDHHGPTPLSPSSRPPLLIFSIAGSDTQLLLLSLSFGILEATVSFEDPSLCCIKLDLLTF